VDVFANLMHVYGLIAETLGELYTEMTRMLDARVVAAYMYQRNALTLRELQSIQSLRDRPVETAETLLNIIMEQPDAVFLCFLDVLKCSEQQHIYQRLVQRGYRGRKHVINLQNYKQVKQQIYTTITRTFYNEKSVTFAIRKCTNTVCLPACFPD